MFKSQEGIGDRGQKVPGPPWILGHRGASREAPENTLAAMLRALELGTDGVEYDLRACASGEAILIHDDTLDRTTDARGPVARRTLPELSGVDAGGWFDKRFAGEPLPLFEEALELMRDEAGALPQHMIDLKDSRLVGEVARLLAERREPLTVRVASFSRRACLEARDLHLPTMLLSVEASEDDLHFVTDEAIDAYGTGPGGFRVAVGRTEWPCEKWSWAVDDPADLYAACRTPLFGFNTNYPERALSVRALTHLAPDDSGGYPLQVPRLEVLMDPSSKLDPKSTSGVWSGHWQVPLSIRNPFPFPVAVALAIVVRGGAFRVEGLPEAIRLGVGEEEVVGLDISGGSFSPGEDPYLFARYVWRRGPGRPEESLILDAPLERVRSLSLRRDTARLAMLRERASDPSATMTLRLRQGEVLARVEDSGGLRDVQALLRLGARSRVGGPGVRLRLSPLDELELDRGLAFSVGFLGIDPRYPDRPPRLRRFCGGLPEGLFSGAPGRLFLDPSA